MRLQTIVFLAGAALALGCGSPDAVMDPATVLPAPAGGAPDNSSGPSGDADLSADTVLRVHYPLAAGSSLSVRGSAAPFNWTSGTAMTRTATDTYELRVKKLKTAIEWKPLIGDATWSRGSNYRASPGQTVDIYPHFINGSGRYQRYYKAFHSTILTNDRGVWIYLPPSFDENPLARYPVVYMHDGQNLFDPRYAFGGRTWQVSETLNAGIDALDATAHIAEMVVIGPENTSGRIYEYTPTPGDDPMYMGGGGDLYLRFLKEELKPAIEADPLFKNRLLVDRDHTALAGSSLGGLITAYAGVKQPDLWSRIGVFSPSTWWDSLYIVTLVAGAGGVTPREARVYVDSGSPDDDTDNTKQLAATYRGIGYRDDVDFKYVVAPGAAHNEDAWAARLPAALRFLSSDW